MCDRATVRVLVVLRNKSGTETAGYKQHDACTRRSGTPTVHMMYVVVTPSPTYLVVRCAHTDILVPLPHTDALVSLDATVF
jgi:hypothetical protein